MKAQWQSGISILAFAFAAATATPSFAQAAPAAAAETGLGDIVVTARKVAERLQDVPIAVTAFDGRALEQNRVAKLSDISGIAPGLTIITNQTNGSSIAYFSLRGQNQRSNLATTDPSVGVYVDGVYWARAYGINANLLDVANLQVLRGPQGTLFGRNTTGGAILISTNDPKLNEFSGKVTVDYGRFNYKAGSAVVNVPLVSDKLAARVAFQTIDDDGYVRDTLHPGFKYGEQSNYAFRAKLLAQIADDTSLVLSADIYREDRNPDTGELRYVTSTSSTNLSAGAEILGSPACFANTANCAAVGRARIAGIIATNRKNGNVTSSNIINQSTTHTNTYSATLNQATPLGDLKVIGAYRKIYSTFYADYDGSSVNVANYSGRDAIHQWSGEATLTGKALDDRFSYAAGLFYFTERGRDKSDFQALPAISATLTRFNGYIDNKSIGVYGQANYKITDQLTATGGLRWSQDKKQVTVSNGTVLGNIYLPTPGSFVCTVQAGCPLTRSGKFSGLSWTAGLDYKVSSDVMVYAKAARAFRSGGVNLRETSQVNNLPPQAFKPEKVTSFEGGIKSQLLDRRLRFNLAAFYSIQRDAQREFILSSIVGTRVVNTTVAANADRADFYGGEAEVTAILLDTGSDRYTVSGNAAYTKPKYKKYINPQTGFDKSNEPFPYTPKWTASASGTYEHQFAASKLTVSANYTWSSAMQVSEFGYIVDAAGVARSVSDGSAIPLVDARNLVRVLRIHKAGTLDTRAALAFGEDDRYEIAVYGKNVLNNRNYMQMGTVTSLGINGVRRPPATYGISGSVKF